MESSESSHLPAVTSAEETPTAAPAPSGAAVDTPQRVSRSRAPLSVVGLALAALLIGLALALSGHGAAALRDHALQRAPDPGQPAIRGDFADPAILVVGGVYYAYATNAAGAHIQVARSTDLRDWTPLPDALPDLPAWADVSGAWVWAPDVIALDGRFVLYYTARDAASGRQCVGVATSATPAGPFHDASAQPFVCQRDLGGDIDASPFRDGDALYLYFKNDGNCCHLPTRIWGQRLAPDGLSLLGAPVALLTNDQPWEGDVIEAPNMLKRAGAYDLFYSGNDYASSRYAIGYAQCQSPLGPCVKTAASPILASDVTLPTPLFGPGGASLFQAGGATWIAFHTWGVSTTGARDGARYTLIDRLGWRGDVPFVVIPPAAQQPTPSRQADAPQSPVSASVAPRPAFAVR